MIKCNILEAVIAGALRIFKASSSAGGARDFEYYHTGGEDYNPPSNSKAIAGFINDNKKDGVIFLFQDDISRSVQPGEKKIYSTNASGKKIVAEIYLKNDGKLCINTISDLEINTEGQAIINAKSISLGLDGKPIARQGDEVTVDGKTGTITGGGINTSV